MKIKKYEPKEGESCLKCYVASHKGMLAWGHSHYNAFCNLLRTIWELDMGKIK